MLNIGIDISPLTSSVRTGVGEYTYELLNALFDIDSKNQYFLFYNSFTNISNRIPQWKQKNVHVIHTSWPNKIFHFFVQLFRWPKVDLLITKKTGAKLDYFFSPNIGFQAISKHTKHILTIHDLSFEIFPECFSAKMRLWHTFLSPRRQCERADLLLTPSQNTKRDIINLYGIAEQTIQVFNPGLSPFFVREKEVSPNTDILQKYNLPAQYILFLGTVEPRKNIERLLEAFVIFQKEFPEYHLVIAGAPGWKNKHIFRAIEKNKNVQYIGYVAPEDKPALYAAATVFVYPSLYEGFGFPVLEACAVGVPVLTSARSSLPEVAGDAAYYVNPYNTSEIVTGMKRLVMEPDLSKFFIQKGFQQVQKFYWQKTAEQFLASL